MSLSLEQLDKGIDLLIRNAEQLVGEAKALFDLGANARAFALAHLAREELAKATILQAAGLRILARQEVDWKSLMRRLRDHKAKLRMEILENALLLKGQGISDFDAILTVKGLAAVADFRNDLKNVAIYVGFDDNKFVLPSDQINADNAGRTIELAATRLRQVQFECQRSPRLAEREIGSLAHFPVVDEIAEDLDPESLEEIARVYLEIFKLALAGKEDES
jgi:AbiV family abortive infection protein